MTIALSALACIDNAPRCVKGIRQRKRERSMTLLAAVKSEDALWLAADSGVGTDGGLVVLQQKLQFRKDYPIAWGFSGDDGLGQDFNDWLNTADILTGSWPDAWGAAANHLASLNQQRRRISASSGYDPRQLDGNQLLDVLIAGYFAGEPRAMLLDSTGGREPLTEAYPAIFAGSGQLPARLIREVLVEFGQWRSDADMLRRAMRLAIRVCDGLREPVRILRIDRTGVSEW
jgi:hypothetical protein